MLCKRDAPECVASLHGLCESGKLVALRNWFVIMPQLLADVRFVPASPLLNKAGYVLNRLVVATSVSFAVALGTGAENISTSFRFQRRVVCVVATIHHFHIQRPRQTRVQT